MSKLNIFVPLTKVDEENRLVYGVVAEEVLDNSGEMFDYEKSKPYFQKWSLNAEMTSGGLSKGNLRAMHGKVAAGKLTDLGFDDDNRRIECCAKVVDDNEWAKVLEGVYTGFSMGGRYAEKWVEKIDGRGDVKRYAGDPTEISLVDKPCIPTATFQLIKADGAVEEHRFTSVISEDTGDNLMKTDYTPTNDEMLPVAQELAKAAGSNGLWLDFMDQAREQLIAANMAKADAPKNDEDEAKDKGDGAPGGEDKGDFDENAETGPNETGDDDGTSSSESDKGDEEDGDEQSEDGDESDEKKAEKAAGYTPDLKQVWETSDGKTFLKKADAVAHEGELAKASSEPSIVELAKAAAAAASGLLNGEQAEEKTELVKFAEFFEGLAKFDGDDAPLEKSMYTVERMARCLREVASLQVCVAQEQKREGDDSETPAMIGTAVAQLGDTLIEMAKEEVDELLLQVANNGIGEDDPTLAYSTGYYELAAGTLGLEKADFDELAKAAASKKADYVQKMHDKCQKMGAKCAEPLNKADSADELQKVHAANEELRKRADDAEGQLKELEPLVKSLASDIEKLKSMPMPAAPKTSVVEKSADGGALSPAPLTESDLLQKFTPDQLAEAAIRMAQGNGVTMTARGTGQ